MLFCLFLTSTLGLGPQVAPANDLADPKPLGVCSVTDRSAECWDMSGNLDPRLQKIAVNLLTPNLVSLKFGHPNLFALVKSQSPLSAFREAGEPKVVYSTVQRYEPPTWYTIFPLASQTGGATERVDAIFNYSPNWADETRISLGENPSPGKNAGNYLLKGVRSAKWDPDQEYVDQTLGGFTGDTTYIYEIAKGVHPGTDLADPPSLQGYDKDGHVVEYVDRQGRPSDVMHYAINIPDRTQQFPVWFMGNDESSLLYLTATFVRITDAPNGNYRFESNVSPSAIASIGVSNQPVAKFAGNFPLTPRQPLLSLSRKPL